MISSAFRIYLQILTLFCACRFDLKEIDRLRDEGPLIVAANHPSLLDVVMIISRLPNAVCIMKASLMDNILFGAAARLARYIRNDAALDMIIGSRQELAQGAHLVIFPEGSRTLDFPIGPCSSSVGLISNRSKVAVQTILIEFSTPYLGKAWPLFRRPQLPLTCRVRLGRRFPPPTNLKSFTSELEGYFRSELGENPTPKMAPAA
jgi:1-acyl-sn-glycerol-3-phosphate acyltransferase